jgi:acyl carrier protein
MQVGPEIKQFILRNFMFTDDVAALADDASLMEKGIVDSTGVLELVGHIETTYGIKVADTEMVPENLDSVNEIVAFIARKRAA